MTYLDDIEGKICKHAHDVHVQDEFRFCHVKRRVSSRTLATALLEEFSAVREGENFTTVRVLGNLTRVLSSRMVNEVSMITDHHMMETLVPLRRPREDKLADAVSIYMCVVAQREINSALYLSIFPHYLHTGSSHSRRH